MLPPVKPKSGAKRTVRLQWVSGYEVDLKAQSTDNKHKSTEIPEEKTAASDIPHRGVIAEWTVTIILLLFGTTTLVQAFVIPTGSMEDSLLIGDHLLVDKLAYSPHGSIDEYLLPYQDVQRGDIIVFRYPMDLSQTFVKRVVGLPGDRLRLVDKKLILNGQTVDEPYVIHRTAYIDQYRDNFPGQPNTPIPERALEMLRQNVVRNEIVVPPNNYFAMGDNRDQSLDSRYWGFVPRENIIGKPLLIYWSYDAPTERLQDTGISLTHLTDILLNFFGKTRWRRTFNLIHAHALDAQ
ncbi:MAG: signal peptidase I [Acidobacteriia bacterium]|nr:signal peptidase I [Terriglobia bacterium]